MMIQFNFLIRCFWRKISVSVFSVSFYLLYEIFLCSESMLLMSLVDFFPFNNFRQILKRLTFGMQIERVV